MFLLNMEKEFFNINSIIDNILTIKCIDNSIYIDFIIEDNIPQLIFDYKRCEDMINDYNRIIDKINRYNKKEEE